jgi:raffinose/stachyose/melibiose transport system permease protein
VTALAWPRPRTIAHPRNRRGLRAFGVQVLLCAYAVLAFGPILLVLIGSLRSNPEILSNPIGLPSSPSLANYSRAWRTASLSTYFVNSAVVSVLAVGLCVATSSLLAYGLSRLRFRGRVLLSAYVIAGLMVPAKLGLLPVFYMFQGAGLIDTRLGLVLLYAANGIPFSVFVLMGFLRTVPPEMEEAAQIDGANEGRIFWSVIAPQLRPAIAAVTVFQFAPTWNDFFYPLVLIRSDKNYTMPVGLTRFFGEYAADRGALFAGLVVALAPLVLVFVFATKHIIAGLTAGVGK